MAGLPLLGGAAALLAQVLGVVGELVLEGELFAGVLSLIVEFGAPDGQCAERLGLGVVGPPAVLEFGEACLALAGQVFEAWRGFQVDGDRARLRHQIAAPEQKLRELCQAAKRKSTKTRYHRGLARNLIKVWPALWTFTDHDGVEPTNNRTERGLRHTVIYCKLSLGSHSTHGELATERLPSAAISCRLQGRSLFAYLADIAQASARGPPHTRTSLNEVTKRLPD